MPSRQAGMLIPSVAVLCRKEGPRGQQECQPDLICLFVCFASRRVRHVHTYPQRLDACMHSFNRSACILSMYSSGPAAIASSCGTRLALHTGGALPVLPFHVPRRPPVQLHGRWQRYADVRPDRCSPGSPAGLGGGVMRAGRCRRPVESLAASPASRVAGRVRLPRPGACSG